jgi:hypothetical protein
MIHWVEKKQIRLILRKLPIKTGLPVAKNAPKLAGCPKFQTHYIYMVSEDEKNGTFFNNFYHLSSRVKEIR